MAKRNFGLIIIGYGLISIGMMLLLLFFQTSGIAWLIFGVISLVGAILIIKKERTDRKIFFQSDNENLE
jgi:membrane protein implicated in regulation of membrane protease activity